MHLTVSCKARFTTPIMTTSKMTIFSNAIRLKELITNFPLQEHVVGPFGCLPSLHITKITL